MSGTSLKPSRVEINVVANLLGTGATVLIGLAFVPIFVRFLGVEAYGLIGFHAALLATLQILDLGLSSTINRELARLSAIPGQSGSARDFVRTLEIPYWSLGVAIGAIIALAAPIISRQWLQVATLPIAAVQSAVVVMGVVFVLQWPISLYQGGLQGLQRQPLANAINVSLALIRNIGAVLVLAYVSTSIVAFFFWQAIASGIHVLILMLALWSRLPKSSNRPRFKIGELKRIWRFAVGMSVIAITGIILIQIDKIVLSRLLNLPEFGYYALAALVGTSLAYVVGPVFNAVFPRFSTLVARDEKEALTQLYHRATQFLAVILLPTACTLAILAMDIMRLWTGDLTTAQHTQQIVTILAIGSAINGLMTMPYALQLAYGWTSIGVRINLLLILLAVPSAIILGSLYGGPGAASVWILTNSVYMLIGVPATHRRLMPGEAWRWLLIDILGPFCASLAVVLVGLRLTVPVENRLLDAIRIAAILIASVGAAVLAAPMMRKWAAMRFHAVGAAAMSKLPRRTSRR